MAKYGYCFIRQEVCYIATDYAMQLGKTDKGESLHIELVQ